MILVLETSTDLCSISVIANGKTKSKTENNIKKLHAEKLISLIDQTLGNINVNLELISAIAISIGPGSFTGLRVGLSIAKGLCYTTGKPLIAVPTLDALALKATKVCKIVERYVDDDLYICPILNAKQNDFYYSLYKFQDGKLTRTMPYLFGSVDEIKREVRKGFILIGDGIVNLKENFYNQDVVLIDDDEFNRPDASYVGKIAEDKYRIGDFADINSIEPLYVKEFTIKTK
ncbi:MAG: tRNA (adenosine(37)-N6)-threonylcarbamoyltransferase complex dimerization subunit type 1 TsaB [Candidatus Kryptonium sp.]